VKPEGVTSEHGEYMYAVANEDAPINEMPQYERVENCYRGRVHDSDSEHKEFNDTEYYEDDEDDRAADSQ
jgi:hypothetical protein